jgi:hypothetical protein
MTNFPACRLRLSIDHVSISPFDASDGQALNSKQLKQAVSYSMPICHCFFLPVNFEARHVPLQLHTAVLLDYNIAATIKSVPAV